MKKWEFWILVALVPLTGGCRDQNTNMDLQSMADRALAELHHPWPGDCRRLWDSIEAKRLCATAAYAVRLEDQTRGKAAAQTLVSQFKALPGDVRSKYAPVLSRLAVLSSDDDGRAIKMWLEADSLMGAALDICISQKEQWRDWRKVVRLEGVIVFTRAGYSDNADTTLRKGWLEKARLIADAVGRPDMAPPSGLKPMDREPEMIHFEKPQYPEAYRRAGIQGTVVAKVLVGEFGQVREAEILEGLNPDLDAMVLEAAKKCRFSPGRKGGVPCKAFMALPITFSLDESQDNPQ